MNIEYIELTDKGKDYCKKSIELKKQIERNRRGSRKRESRST
ncbi:hypothetical protein ACSXEN_01045 [Clostridium perfringens]